MSNAEPNCKEQYCSGVGNCCCVTYGQFKYLMSYYKTGKVDHMGIENLENVARLVKNDTLLST